MTTVVIGSGPSAVHFAQSTLDRGKRVLMIDVGHAPSDIPLPTEGLRNLRRDHDDAPAYFLGENAEYVVYPGADEEYYGIPPSKGYVFEGVAQNEVATDGFAPLSSYARGGLAEAWTGGVYPFNDAELEAFPIDHSDLAPWYDEVARRIGISGEEDDLASVMPMHAHLQDPLELDEHSRRLMDRYRSKHAAIHGKLGAVMGRSRIALQTKDANGRKACTKLGRCLWGCPSESLYTPSITLRELERREGFEYASGYFVTHFELDARKQVTRVVCESVETGESESFDVDELVLAAGTLSTSKIVLESLHRAGEPNARLTGLMDNRQVLVPFVNLSMIGRPWDEDSYQYHMLNLSLQGDDPREYVHGQITTLKTAMIHPIAQSVPLDLRTALYIFKHVHAALGLLNVNFRDTRRDENTVELAHEGERSVLRIRYRPADDEARRVEDALRRYKKILRRLGCIVPPGMAHTRPMGASVHYSGTLPMTAEERPLTLSPEGRLRGFENLWVVDGSGLPFLPAKNLTFTLMSNAARIGGTF